MRSSNRARHAGARPRRGKSCYVDAPDVCEALGGDWRGGYGVAFCPAHPNSNTPALSLKNATDGRLLVHCFAGCTWQEVLNALRESGLLDIRVGRHAAGHMVERRATEAADRVGRIELARRIWMEAVPIGNTLAERYLRNRAITCELPWTLKFNPNCLHRPTETQCPAMIAAVTLDDEIVGIHRTYLAEPGVKAFGDDSKMMLGPCAGGAVRLSGGDGPLVVAEGIETALSLLTGLSHVQVSVWAALSTSGMKKLVLPTSPGELVIAPDGDDPGEKAGRRLADRADANGWQVGFMRCPPGKDWNDVLMEEAP